MRRPSVVAVFVITALLAACTFTGAAHAASGADGDEPASYVAPVDAPIVDSFRPPAEPYGAGNRGIDFATAPGTPVLAAATGVVAYAGRIAGSWHVVVVHVDGLRTSYSFLERVAVQRGDRVAAGDVVGVTGAQPLHFGVRAGDTYLDPMALLAGPARVYLVPEDERAPDTEADERSAVALLVRRVGGGLARAGAAALSWARAGSGAALAVPGEVVDMHLARVRSLVDQLRAAGHYSVSGLGPVMAVRLPWRLAEAAAAWHRQRSSCTPASTPVPDASGRRLLVLVGGLGSSGGGGALHAAVGDIDTAALGVRAEDVHRFSYNGGTVSESSYASIDTQRDLRDSARQLRALLERLRFAHPGVPVDVVAHSQGGLVTRTYLAYEHDALDPRLPLVPNVVTLGTPFSGADLATAAAALRDAPYTGRLLAAASWVDPFGLDPASPSLQQLAETSRFLADMPRAIPDGVRLTSIAARADVIVPAHHSRVAGATNVVVDVGGLNAHDALPGSPAAVREVALALRGMAPTCQTLADMLTDTAVGSIISGAEDSAAAATLFLSYRAAFRGT
jgi:hypothetical protein